MLPKFLLFIHVLAVVVWVGGMYFVLTCLRPASADLLPAQRAPLMVAALERFFLHVLVAIVALWASGLAMLLPVGMAAAPPGWHMMLGGGVVMTLVFAWIRWVAFPPTRRAAATDDLPGAATGLGRIRLLVVANLVIGILTIAAATLAA